MPDDWLEALRARRERKDTYFGESPHSPLPPAERAAFDGLAYYPPDPDFRFVLPLEEHDEKATVEVATSTDGERTYFRWGAFRFAVDGEPVVVQAYKGDPDDERLWVPFRDGTSGGVTYGAGRYLDLEPATHRTEAGEWILDFNEAYNPTCAYDDGYECPLPPTENWLDVAIEAGEKAYH